MSSIVCFFRIKIWTVPLGHSSPMFSCQNFQKCDYITTSLFVKLEIINSYMNKISESRYVCWLSKESRVSFLFLISFANFLHNTRYVIWSILGTKFFIIWLRYFVIFTTEFSHIPQYFDKNKSNIFPSKSGFVMSYCFKCLICRVWNGEWRLQCSQVTDSCNWLI